MRGQGMEASENAGDTCVDFDKCKNIIIRNLNSFALSTQ